MFQNITSYVIGQDFKQYLKPIVEAPGEAYPLNYTDIAQYADCPARWHKRQTTLEDELNVFEHILALAAAAPPAFDKTYAVPPATLQTPTLVCPRCGSASTAKLCSDCGLIRQVQNLALPYSPASKAGKQWKERAAHSGRLPLTPARAARALGAATAVRQDPAVASLMADVTRLLAISAEWVSDVARKPVPVRALITVVPEAWSPEEAGLVAIVGCTTAHPVPFAVHTYRRGLHVRAALELDLYNASHDDHRNKYLLAAVETEPPHVVARRLMTAEGIAAGQQVYEQALDNYAVSLATDYWPDYDIARKNRPAWSEIDPEGALHNQALALVGGPLPGPDPEEPAPAEPSAPAA